MGVGFRRLLDQKAEAGGRPQDPAVIRLFFITVCCFMKRSISIFTSIPYAIVFLC